jgi:hypothetical protein
MDIRSSPSWLEGRALPLFFLDGWEDVDSVGSGWVSPAPKRDRRVLSFRGLFWEVVGLGSVVVEFVVVLGGFLRRDWEARGGCRRVVSFAATPEVETALLEVAGFRRRGGRGWDVELWLTPLSLSPTGNWFCGFDLFLLVLTLGFLFGFVFDRGPYYALFKFI